MTTILAENCSGNGSAGSEKLKVEQQWSTMNKTNNIVVPHIDIMMMTAPLEVVSANGKDGSLNSFGRTDV